MSSSAIILLALQLALGAVAFVGDGASALADDAHGPSGDSGRPLYIRWGTPRFGDHVDVAALPTGSVASDHTAQGTLGVSGTVQEFEENRGSIPGESETNYFVDFRGGMGVQGGANNQLKPIVGFSGDENFTWGHIFGGTQNNPAPYLGATLDYGGQVASGVPSAANGMRLVAGLTEGVFFNGGDKYAFYAGLDALLGGRFNGTSDGVIFGGGAGLGAVVGVFTATDAFRLRANRIYWTDQSAPFAGNVSYERVLNPAVVEDNGFQMKGVRWSVGVESQATQSTAGLPASVTVSPFVKATL